VNLSNKDKEFCDFCGKRFAPRPQQRFCSIDCNQKYHTAERRKALEAFRKPREPKPMTFACDECGKEFRPTPLLQNFCTVECRQAFHRRIEKAEGTEFVGIDPGTPEQREAARQFLAEFVQPEEPIRRRV
jgi:hypothetical protein